MGKEKTPGPTMGKPSALLDARVVYCGLRRAQSSRDKLEQLAKLPNACVDLICINPPFSSNRNYEIFWGETKKKRWFEDRHASAQAYIDYVLPSAGGPLQGVPDHELRPS